LPTAPLLGAKPMSGRDCLDRLAQASPAVLPSLLLCDFGNLEREVERLEEAGAAAFHLDVMDGQFVPNLTYGMPIVAALRRLTRLPLDVHLMIERPERYLREFRDSGADLLTIHVEATAEPAAVLRSIRDMGLGAGLAVNPGTPLDGVERCLEFCDLALVMSVPAGFGGQPFDRAALERVRRLRQLAGDRLLLEMDGGINDATIGDCAAAGAQLLVVGSGIFRASDYGEALRRLTSLASSGKR
jgi:ribulose-phosphate 3-epimerase